MGRRSEHGGAGGGSLLPAAVYLGLAVALSWPLLLHLDELVVGAPRSDVWNSLWSLWWVSDRLFHGELPLHTNLLDHPRGGWLFVADPLDTFAAAPLTRWLGPVRTYGLLVLAQLAFGAWAAHRLARELGGTGWVAGVGYGFSAFALAHAHNGASEAMALGWLPLFGLSAYRLARGRGSVLAGGLLLFLCALANWYEGLDAWLLLGSLLLLGLPGRSRGQLARRLLPAAALGLGLTLPLAAFVRSFARRPDGLVAIKAAGELARIRRTLGPADPRIFFVPGDFRSPDFRFMEGNPGDYAHLAYLGWLLLALALLGPPLARRLRRTGEPPGWGLRAPLLLGGAVALVLSLGPVLVVDGHPVSVAGVALPLPYLLLEKLPGFDALSLLYRLAGLGVLAAAVLGDLGLAALAHTLPAPLTRAAGPLAAGLVLAETLLLSPARGLPARTPLPPYPALEALAAAPPGAVLNLPVAANRDYLYEQLVHRKPLAAGLNTGGNRAAFAVLAELRREARGREARVERVARSWDLRYAVVHRGQLVDEVFLPALRALRERHELLAEDGRVRVYRLW